MKHIAWIPVLVIVGICPAVGVPPQHDMQHMPGMNMPMRKALGVKLDVQDDTAHKTLTVRVGPLDLPARASHHTVAQAPDQYLTIPFDGWITAYHPRLVDDSGHTVPNHLLHHVAFYNLSRADFLCPKKPEHIFGAGGEMNDWPANPGIGYPVHKGDRIMIGTMFHNPTGTNYPKTYIEIRMEYQPASAGELKSVYPAWFDVKGCGPSGYDLTPGKNLTSGEFTLSYSGRLIGVGGHMHDYGQQLLLQSLTHNETIATLSAKLDPKGQILSMPIVLFIDRGGYPLNQGDQIKVTATYDNRSGKALPEGAMGIVVGYFIPDQNSAFASLARK